MSPNSFLLPTVIVGRGLIAGGGGFRKKIFLGVEDWQKNLKIRIFAIFRHKVFKESITQVGLMDFFEVILFLGSFLKEENRVFVWQLTMLKQTTEMNTKKAQPTITSCLSKHLIDAMFNYSHIARHNFNATFPSNSVEFFLSGLDLYE